MDPVYRLSPITVYQRHRVSGPKAESTSTLHDALAEALGRPFHHAALLEMALTHASFLEGRVGADNERLEFLGDRVLGLIAAEHLLQRYPDMPESALAPRLNSIVNRQACAKAAIRAGIGPALRLSKAEINAGGREKETILADAAEAVLAALYLEGGLVPVREFVLTHWADALREAEHLQQDAKTALQEWAAAHRHGAPLYTEMQRSGPDHAPRFIIRVETAGSAAEAEGASKREAERLAAAALLRIIRPHE